MKAIFFILFNIVLLGNVQSLFAQKLSFTFDAAGNQNKREWVCINCPQVPGLENDSHTILKANEPIKIGDILLLSDSINQTIELSWSKGNSPFLQQIEIVDAEGKSVFIITLKPSQNSERISFSSLPAGDYQLLAQYSDHKKEPPFHLTKI